MMLNVSTLEDGRYRKATVNKVVLINRAYRKRIVVSKWNTS